MDQAVKVMNNNEGKYFTFILAGEEYGLGILKVKEIISSGTNDINGNTGRFGCGST